MHDIKWIRENPEEFDKGLARRGSPPRSQEILEADKEYCNVQTALQQYYAKRNELSKKIMLMKQQQKQEEQEAENDIRRTQELLSQCDLSNPRPVEELIEIQEELIALSHKETHRMTKLLEEMKEYVARDIREEEGFK